MPLVIIVILILLILIAALMIGYLRNRIIVAADEAAIIYGRKSKITNPETGDVEIVGSRVVVKGNGVFVWPWFESLMRIDLQSYNIPLQVENIMSRSGIKVNVEAVAVVKVANDPFAVRKAATQFGDTKREQANKEKFRNIVSETLQGHFRSIISTLTAEELHFEREKFTQQVQQAAGTPLASMGIEIISFTMKSVTDDGGYLDLLAVGQKAEKHREEYSRRAKAEEEEKEATSKAKRNQALYEKELRIVEEESRSEQEKAKIKADKTIEVEENIQQIGVLKKEQERLKEEYILTSERKKLRNEERNIELIKYQLEADKIKIEAEAQAEAIKQKLIAEAEGKHELARVYKEADPSTKLLLIMDQLPAIIEKILGKEGLTNIFKEIAQPLGNIDSVQIYDFGNNGNGEYHSPLSKFIETTPLLVKKLLAQFNELGIHLDVDKLLELGSKEKKETVFSEDGQQNVDSFKNESNHPKEEE